MAKTSVKRAHRTGERRYTWRRPLAAVAIGSLGVVGLGQPAAPAEAEAPNHFEGTFSSESYTPTSLDERCSFLERDYFSEIYEYTFDFPEQDWAYRATTCATVSGDPLRYTAVGTFTITRPGGTLLGSYAADNLLPIPADAVGTLHITDGTGLYEDASGTCTLSDFVGLSGNVTCDVSPK